MVFDETPLLEWEADARTRLHRHHPTHRSSTPDSELMSLIGEAEFARVFKQPFNWERLPGGDGGIDFIVPVRITIDVKTSRNAYNVICEEGEATADIYVQASYNDDTRKAKLLKWAYGKTLARAPVKNLAGIRNHCIPLGEARDLDELGRRIMHLV